jgi:hypothetical protein
MILMKKVLVAVVAGLALSAGASAFAAGGGGADGGSRTFQLTQEHTKAAMEAYAANKAAASASQVASVDK